MNWMFNYMRYLLMLVILQFSICNGQEAELVIQTGHTEGISNIVFSYNNKLLASASHIGNIIIWDLSVDKQLLSIKLPDSKIEEMLFDSANTRLYVKHAASYSFVDIKSSKSFKLDSAKYKAFKNIYYESINNTIRYKINKYGYYAEVQLINKPYSKYKLTSDYIDKNFTDIKVSTKSELIIGANEDSKIHLKSLNNRSKTITLTEHSSSVNCIAISSDERLFASGSDDRSIIVWDVKTLDPIKRFYTKVYRKTSVCFSESGKYLAVGDEAGGVYILNMDFSRIDFQYKLIHKDRVSGVLFLNSDKYLATSGYDNSIQIHQFEDLERIKEFKLKNSIGAWRENRLHNQGFSFDSKAKVDQLFILGNNLLAKGSYQKSILRYSSEFIFCYPLCTQDVPTEKRIDISSYLPVNGPYHQGQQVYRRDSIDSFIDFFYGEFLSGKIAAKINNGKFSLPDFDFAIHPKKNIIATCGGDGKVKLWNINEKELIISIVFTGKGVIIFSPDHYYMGDKNAVDGISFKVSNQAFPVEQFDLKYNRPDKVISAIHPEKKDIIKMYKSAYTKRLNKLNINQNMLSKKLQLPHIEIQNKENIPFVVYENKIEIRVKAWDNYSRLNRCNIWVNNVPVYGLKGIDLTSNNNDNFIYNASLNLSEGNNKIQVSCLNNKAVESLKETIEITYKSKENIKPDLFIIAISTSKYRQSEFNLKYAVKDGMDIVRHYGRSKAFNNVYIDTLFNQNAVRENIARLKRKLLKSKVDDQVILFVSGHGLLDENYDFFFAGYDMDFNDPAKNGISYYQLENLIDSIPARKKLFMMDACHSGEVDKEDLMVLDDKKINEGLKTGIKSYKYRAKVLQQDEPVIGLSNSFELMQEYFTNLNQGSGTVVISAAAGDSYAIESDIWNNGVFTFSVLNGLQSKEADMNSDKEISVSELRTYVIDKVQYLTDGKQKPTCRQNNVEFDFRVW